MRLLLIDDNEGVRALARTYAEAVGCTSPTEAGDGETALSAASTTTFDAAIVDFHMPGIDGLETTRRLLELQPDMAVLAWTSVLDPAVEQAFVKAGARRHIPKTDIEMLRDELARLCG